MPNSEENAAIAWAVRLSNDDEADWDGFQAWLAEDAARGTMYRRVVAELEETISSMAAFPSCEEPPALVLVRTAPRHVWRRWLPAGVAAIAAGVAGVLLVGRPVDVPKVRIIDALAGSPRHVVLADGSTVDLAPGGRLAIQVDRPRHAALDRGRAVFTVRHDPNALFRVSAGSHDIVDIGTTFEVVQSEASTDVAVQEGAVIVDPASAGLRLRPGFGTIMRGGEAPRAVAVPIDAVGRWSRDRMSYRDASLAVVASDLSLALGRSIVVDRSLNDRRFSGSLVVGKVRMNRRELASLLDVTIHEYGDRWVLRMP